MTKDPSFVYLLADKGERWSGRTVERKYMFYIEMSNILACTKSKQFTGFSLLISHQCAYVVQLKCSFMVVKIANSAFRIVLRK